MNNAVLQHIVNLRAERGIEKDWRFFQRELDLVDEGYYDLPKNEVGVLEKVVLLVEVRNTGTGIANPIDAFEGQQMQITGEQHKAFEFRLVQNINDEIFTYQVEIKRTAVYSNREKIQASGEILDGYTSGNWEVRTLQGYALINLIY